ncbi:MAG TPA: VOC family protein [Kofleriaceae bacterium]
MAMTRPFTVRRLDHVVLRVRDVARMRAFYCDVLGCQVEREQPELGLTQLRVGESLIDLVSIDGKLGRVGGAAPGADGRNVDHVCLAVAPYDEAALRAFLVAQGVEVGAAGSRYGAEGEGPSLYLRDPEGNDLELKGPATSPPRRA